MIRGGSMPLQKELEVCILGQDDRTLGGTLSEDLAIIGIAQSQRVDGMGGDAENLAQPEGDPWR